MSAERRPPVRWRDDVGWELRCETCAEAHRQQFWPLTDEFWSRKQGMRRCRACINEVKAKAVREKYRADKALAARKRQQAAAYYAELRSDPVAFDAWRRQHTEQQRVARARKRAA